MNTKAIGTTQNGRTGDPARAVVVFVPGVLTWPGAARNWTGRAVTWTHISTPYRAEKVEYLSGPGASRLLGQRSRVQKLARTLEYYRGFDVTLVGHSNGCSVILGALKRLCPLQFRAGRVVFVAPVLDADCERNGINSLMRCGHIGRLDVFIGGRDWQAAVAGSWIGRLFGYGAMGVEGPRNCLKTRTRVTCNADWGHSDWWGDGPAVADAQFEWTMRKILLKYGQ